MKKLKLLSFGLLSVLLTTMLVITGINKVLASFNTYIIFHTENGDVDLTTGGDLELEFADGDFNLSINSFTGDYAWEIHDASTSEDHIITFTGNGKINMKDPDGNNHEIIMTSGVTYTLTILYDDPTIVNIQIEGGGNYFFNKVYDVELHNPYFYAYFYFESMLHKPAISGKHTVINNVDNPYSETRIREIAGLKAMDDYFGDITSDIEVIRDTYTPNNKKVGTYEIEYKATNGAGLSTTFILKVANKDLTKPVITGKATSSVSYTHQFDINNLLATYSVSDNHDETVILKVESNSYTGNKIGIPGTYQIHLSATDTSGNKATAVHTLTVIDDIKPIITDEHTGTIRINFKDKVTNELLLMGLTANDHIDGDLTSKIKIVENNLTNKLGKYTVKYEVTDKAGNKTTLTRTYEIITTDSPIFWVSKNLLLISEVNNLTLEQLASELASYENIKMASFAVISNDYEGNENEPGEYVVKLAIADTDGTEHQVERTIRVFAEEDLPETTPNFFQKVLNFLGQIWKAIVAVFNWTINAIKWTWNFVFGWIK